MTGLWARTPLRIKLVAALLALVTAALALAGFAAAASLRSYLFRRADDQLRQTAQQFGFDRGRGMRFPPEARGGIYRDGLPLPPGYYEHITIGGRPTKVTELSDPSDGPRLPEPGRVPLRRPFTVSSVDGDRRWRVLAVRREQNGVAMLARDLSDETSTVNRLVFLEVVIGLSVLGVLGGLGYVVVRRSLRPLVAVQGTAFAIASGDLSQRVPESDPRTEVGGVAASLNAMLQQIETAFRERERSEAAARRSEQRMRQFVADASHELRTPLTSIRGFAELYRQGAAGPKDVPRLMRRIEDEGARMGLLVDDLLLLARLDEERPLANERVDLVRLAADAVHDAHAVDPDRQVRLDAGDAGAVEVAGDEARLRQVLGNLVGNALKYTPAGTPVEVRLRAADGHAVVDVVDHGPGLSGEERARVFERFYRADQARTHADGGTGLGLAIVAAITNAHRGSVSVADTPGGGATFTVRLPLAT